MNRFFALAFVSSLSLVAACSPYSPDLGSTPFRCGSSMECPDGYDCKMSGTDNVCVSKSGGTTVDGAGSGVTFNCSKDSVLEGSTHNDTIQTASSTPLDSQRLTIAYSDLVICNMTDIDLYRVDASQQEQIKATVVYQDPAMGGDPLDVSILLGTGTAAVNGQPNGTNTVTANLPNAAASTPYYVRVQDANGMHGNYYDLTITITR